MVDNDEAQLPFDSVDEVSCVKDSRARAIRRRRNKFRTHPSPKGQMSALRKAWTPGTNLSQAVPAELESLVNWFEGQPDARERFRWALRDSLDECLDGQRTGRWAYQHLTKTEKTYLGTAVEVNLTKEFEIENGADLDWQVLGIDLDCKFSKDAGSWEIPMEMYLCPDHGDRSGKADHPALLVWFNDNTGHWAAGMVKVTDDRLRWKVAKEGEPPKRAYNRDNKRKFADHTFTGIYWLWGGLQRDLPSNLLLGLADDARSRIFADAKSGQKRVNQLFREVQGRIVGRQTVLTVAQQDDAPKRARDARIQLRTEGIIVLGHQDMHPKIARALNITVPVKGEWIAVRLKSASANETNWFAVDGVHWTVATAADPVVAAPELPAVNYATRYSFPAPSPTN
ncbi:restriction endonuclease [Nocardia gipuzkoensis]|uniref:NaeI family type II restriction endonuclease n=1 Tax=Nocardia gipuzkoensis TaxID=2749991 RepID=UPI001E64BC92|nr:NaeI family type II restriction endonuclease [Nocardia gipuzkoensis]UGT66109.1 restriction endonuclease [Nocardia gipuzkoensis]